MLENIDLEFCNIAKLTARYSNDESTKVGAVLSHSSGRFISSGWNRWSTERCHDIPSRAIRPLKYRWMIHAEIAALGSAAQSGIPTNGATLHLPFDSVPCTECCKALIAAGVSRIVCLWGEKFEGKGRHWAEDLVIARTMLEEAGITVDVVYPKD